jgi:hypothetical protein
MDKSDILDAVKHADRLIEADVGDTHTLTRVKESWFIAGDAFRAHLKAFHRSVANQHLIGTISVHTLRKIAEEN